MALFLPADAVGKPKEWTFGFRAMHVYIFPLFGAHVEVSSSQVVKGNRSKGH